MHQENRNRKDLQSLHEVAFGTGITLPLATNPKTFLKNFFTILREAKSGQDLWGKDATRIATQSLGSCIQECLNCGITIFDCSSAYNGSEQRLGVALKKSVRENVFLITKINDFSQFYGRVEECFEESLRQLQTDYVDLLLLHWPIDYPPIDDPRFDSSVPVYARSWKTLEKIYKSGRARAIGVSNFSISQLERLKEFAEILPMANEFECHPLCIRQELNEYCKKNNIHVFAYASLCGMDKRLQNPEMEKIAHRHDMSIPQVILKWHIQRGRTPIFGTSKPQRIHSYAELNDFVLSEEELVQIDSQNINYRSYPDSEHCDFTKGIWIGWEKYKDCCP